MGAPIEAVVAGGHHEGLDHQQSMEEGQKKPLAGARGKGGGGTLEEIRKLVGLPSVKRKEEKPWASLEREKKKRKWV